MGPTFIDPLIGAVTVIPPRVGVPALDARLTACAVFPALSVALMEIGGPTSTVPSMDALAPPKVTA
jgi:hypothetical protein